MVDLPALTPQDRAGFLPTETGMLPGEPTQPLAELHILGWFRPRAATLSRTVLAHHPTRPTFRYPEPLLEDSDCSPATVRGHHFPSANSLSIALSNSASASSFFSRAFSASSSFSRLTASAFIPP